MSLYDDIDTDKKSESLSGWASGIKFLQSHMKLKKATMTQPKRDLSRKQPAGSRMSPVVDLKAKAASSNNDSDDPSGSGGGTLTSSIILPYSLTTTITKTDKKGKTRVISSYLSVDPEWQFDNEYDPVYPNDYEKALKEMRERRDKEAEENESKRKLEAEEKDEDEDFPPPSSSRKERESKGGVAIAPPPSLTQAQSVVSAEYGDDIDRSSGSSSKSGNMNNKGPVPSLGLGSGSGVSAAARIMAKYGYKEGQGLGRKEQGMSTALQVEKISHRTGRIIHEKDLPKEGVVLTNPSGFMGSSLASSYIDDEDEIKIEQPDMSMSLSFQEPKEITSKPVGEKTSKVVLLTNMVGPGEVDDDLEPEVKEECEKYGSVLTVTVFQMPDVDSEDAIRIFVEFTTVDAARKGKIARSQPSSSPASDPSVSIISLDDTLISIDESNPAFSEAVGLGDAPVEGILTVWAPVDSKKLINADIDQSTYSSASAFGKLEPATKQRKKKKKCCGCCSRKGVMSSNSFDTFGPPETFHLQSAEDMVVLPTDVFPLEMLSTLEMTPSQVVKAPKQKRRSRVPEKPDKPMSLWGLIKSAIGKDLTKFPLPVNFGEPLSMLQRLTEDYEYSSILDKASKITDSLEQLASVAAFTVSSYATCAIRTAKPFNPLLGETYECDRTSDLGWRAIAEQVCHHPPIASLHCESVHGWVHWQQFTMKSNFRGTYLEVHPLGVAHLRFKTSENHYTWRKVNTIIRNLYVGKMYIEQEGEMDIINHTTGERCHLKYTCGGMFSRDRTVIGRIYSRSGEPKWDLKGAWDSDIAATKYEGGKPGVGDEKTFWKANSLPSDAEKHYNFSTFACQLNEMEEGVAPTDCRHRPDQRFMENGNWDEANLEKSRLEEKQRETRKARQKEGTASTANIPARSEKSSSTTAPTSLEDGMEPFYTPCWFVRQRDAITGQYIYMYNGDYWNCKKTQDWSRCPKIFDK